MRVLLIVITLMLVVFEYSSSETKYPNIESFELKSKTMKAYIGEYPITIHLEYQESSPFFIGVYSVKGWYYYDKFKKPIDLVGIYGLEQLTLYHLSDSSLVNDILKFESVADVEDDYWNAHKIYDNLNEFKEKFVFKEEGASWTNKAKKLKLELIDSDYSILRKYNFLHLDKEHIINLNDFNVSNSDYSIEASSANNILLSYVQPSRTYVMGMCGAGTEEGIIVLTLGKDKSVLQVADYLLNSCNEAYIAESEEIRNGVFRYNYEESLPNGSDKLYYKLIVDYNKATVEIIK